MKLVLASKNEKKLVEMNDIPNRFWRIYATSFSSFFIKKLQHPSHRCCSFIKCRFSLQIKSEIPYRIPVRNILHHASQHSHICRIFPVLNPSADQFAQDPPEIFVSGIGQEAPGIRQHPNKVPQQS